VGVCDRGALTAAVATRQVAGAMAHDGVLAGTAVFLVETSLSSASPARSGGREEHHSAPLS